MDQLRCASLSHTTHYWYEMGMLKVPAFVCVCVVIPFILDVRFVDASARVRQEEGHTGFIHLPSAVIA